jgi:hypothetical protein
LGSEGLTGDVLIRAHFTSGGGALVKQSKRLSDKQIFRYWVEVRGLKSGSVRKLPLTAVKMICLKRGKKNEPPLPDKELLRLQDDKETWEVETFDELRSRLREKYPDAAFERTLHYVRDHEAEGRHERALNGLISLLAKKAVDDLIAEQSRVDARTRRVSPATSGQLLVGRASFKAP